MPLPSFLKRKDPPPAKKTRGAAATEDSGGVEAARTRARRRLIGAVVLLAVGIIVFPLVFETQPRPLAPNLSIEVARNGAREAEVPPAERPPASRPRAPVLADAPSEPPPEAAASAAPAVPPPALAATEAPPPASATPVRPAPEAPASPKPAPVAASKPAPAGASKPAPSHEAAPDARRAQALLEGAPAASAAKGGRFVVQVGAYTDAVALREARAKVEKLGLKTYTQVIETEAGKRTRVRVGPFASREEADGAVARIKSAGLPVAVLAL